jgi:hypothetical protein
MHRRRNANMRHGRDTSAGIVSPGGIFRRLPRSRQQARKKLEEET